MHVHTIALTLISFVFSALFSAQVFAAKYATKKYCDDPDYKCIKVKRGQSWQSLFPDPTEREIVRKLNRTNGGIWGGLTIVVPKDMANKDLLDFAPFPRNIIAPGQRTIMVEPTDFAWGAYDEDGTLVNWGPMSGGKNWCSDIGQRCKTVSGEFEVYRKGGAGCKSRKFHGAPMPYCMFFEGGFALHASRSVPGYHASHGCVRIYQEDAAWLNKNFVLLPEDGGTSVIISTY